MAAAAGSGKAELWSRAKVTAAGNDLSGEVDACGLVLPETVFTAAGALATPSRDAREISSADG